jgi:hypothetical protein
MTYNAFVSGGSSLTSDTVCQAFVEAVMAQAIAEQQFNRDNRQRPVNYITMGLNLISGVLAGQVKIPLKPEVDAVNFKVGHARVDSTPGYSTFVPGTGSVALATNLPDAIAILADRIDSTERYIIADIVTVTPNTIKILEDTDNNLMTIDFALPMSTLVDATTGALTSKARGFLQRLDDQIAQGEITGLPA